MDAFEWLILTYNWNYLDSRFFGNDNFSGNLEAEPRGILFD